MHRTTINLSEPVFQQAKIKALREQVTVSEVIRELLARWVADEIDLDSGRQARDRQVALARAARGMWADRDPDAFLAASRAGLLEHDEELAHAHLDA
jgi:Arc/MetJ-type ribon-helix-helix transcriptional regulator